MKRCRFAQDYEQLARVAETLFLIATAVTLVKRWAQTVQNTLSGSW